MTMGRCHFVMCDSMLGSRYKGRFMRLDKDRWIDLEVLLCREHEQQVRMDYHVRLPWAVTDEGWVYPMVMMDALYGEVR